MLGCFKKILRPAFLAVLIAGQRDGVAEESLDTLRGHTHHWHRDTQTPIRSMATERSFSTQDVDLKLWSTNIEIPNNPKSNFAPELAVFRNKLYVVYKGESSTTLYYAIFDGTNWSVNNQIPGSPKSDQTPSIARYNNKLYMVYKGASSSTLYYATFDGSSWSVNHKISSGATTPKSSHGPSIAVYNDKLYMVYKGADSKTLYYATYDGSSWSVNNKIESAKSNLTPSIVAYNNKLYMVYKGEASSTLYYATYNGSSWSVNNKIAGPNSLHTPSICTSDNKLYMTYKGETTDQLYYGTYNGSSWSVDNKIDSSYSGDTPKVREYLNTLYVVYTNSFQDEDNKLFYATYMDGYSPWMKQIADTRKLSELTLPGTHDTATYTMAQIDGFGFVKTQTLDFWQQFDAGVRFFDIRAGLKDDVLKLYHGILDLKQTFADLMIQAKAFFDVYPSECLVLSLKKEVDTEDSSMTFDQAFKSFYDQNPSLWFVENRIPTLEEARGKIVLFRRFALENEPTPLGINGYDGFEDNTTFRVQFSDDPDQWLYCEDVYTPASFDAKKSAIEDHFSKARGLNNSNDLFLTFTTASDYLRLKTPLDFAKEINPWLLTRPKRVEGIVATDFISAEVARSCYRNSFGYTILFSNGGIHNYGAANFYGHGVGTDLPAVSIAMTPSGEGYWILSSNGSIHNFGDALHKGQGSGGETAVSIAPTQSGNGYWILSSTGNIYPKGDAVNYGQGVGTDKPAVGLARTQTASGYWILCSNGKVYAKGDAGHHGDGIGAGQTAVAIAAFPTGNGYYILCSNGSVHCYNASDWGEGSGGETAKAIVPTSTGDGYYILTETGGIRPFGDAVFTGQGIPNELFPFTAVTAVSIGRID